MLFQNCAPGFLVMYMYSKNTTLCYKILYKSATRYIKININVFDCYNIDKSILFKQLNPTQVKIWAIYGL